jgi:predicted RecB family nuclease
MRLLDRDLILATNDLTKFVRCDHATFLDHATKQGNITPLAMRSPSAMTELITGKGDEHEHAFVEQLRAEGKSIVTIERAPWSLEALRRGEARTFEAMRGGADYIYQAAFFDGRWGGYADLLERVDCPSPVLGRHSYAVVDTKLARAVKPHFVLQLSDYSHHVARLQGVAPEPMHVILGTGQRVSFRVADFDAYHRHIRSSFDRFIARGETATQYPVEFCSLCTWSAHCWMYWNSIDHLSLVANIQRTHVTRLERGGVATLTALAEALPQVRIRRISEQALGVLNHQARLQLQHKRTGAHTFELLPREKDRGFSRLPRPSAGDVFLDLEGDPFVGEGLTYLFGAAWEAEGEAQYLPWWAHDSSEERDGFEAVMDFLFARLAADADAHIYHYGSMEVATLKRLAGRYATREKEVDALLRREAFVDLSAVIRQGMRISHPSYGLKCVETFYYFDRKAEGVADAGGAVLAYERWLETNDETLFGEIMQYNREDCLSIVDMRHWLLSIRPDDAVWKEPEPPQEQSDDRIEEDQKSDHLFRRLMQQESPLLAHLLYYHRREERPAWWWYFERTKNMTDEELVDDSESIGRLQLAGDIPSVTEKKSRIVTYRFPPQEHKFSRGDTAYDRENRAGEIVIIDDAKGTVALKRGPKLLGLADPTVLIPKPSFDSAVIREALRRFATAAIDRGFAASPYRAGVDILLGAPPRLTGTTELRDVSQATHRLDDSYLFVQGPPGSGKTFTGARVIVELLRAGKRVGVTSNSHKAIHNLLDEVESVARAENYWFRGLKKSSGDDDTAFVSKLQNPMIESCAKNADCTDRTIPLVAGTAWLFCDAAMDQSLDYLFIDEAGQVALATAIAVSTAARSIILLGDPLQLAQVSKCAHPDGVGASVLEHLLGQHATVQHDRGIFLGESWRMHPDICEFVSDVVYESRLHSAAECARQTVTIDGIAQTGLRFMAVEHEGNAQSSDEEAARISTEIQRMLRGTFTNAKGVTAQLEPKDFLVVAAYNAQVRHISQALAAVGLTNVQVGTVDKFQGRQAPVVFFSMATSSGAELPRDIDFLFSRNRLNVAISRARCLAIIVASPRLIDVDCKTPRQIRLVNALCRFLEMAKRI